MTMGDSLWVSIIGFTVVFVVLIALILLIKLLSTIVNRRAAKPAAAVTPVPAPAPVHAPTPPPAPPAPLARTIPAPGSSGEVKLHTVDDKTAAMLMAIVANELDAPLNELRFISIREVKAS